jgi:hypothetical protein
MVPFCTVAPAKAEQFLLQRSQVPKKQCYSAKEKINEASNILEDV